MEVLIINVVIAVGLTGCALIWRGQAIRAFCVILLLAIPLYLTVNWMAGYRAVLPPRPEKMNQQVNYYDAWHEGVLAMHGCTFERYVPKVLPYLIALGILALIPCQKKDKSDQILWWRFLNPHGS
jgi:hypothetical protein